MLVIDNYPWPVDLRSLQKFQEKRRRKFDDAFSVSASQEAGEARRIFSDEIDRIFEMLYGHYYRPIEKRNSYRPGVTEGEPMHFDSQYLEGTIFITSYFNFSVRPRKYAVSHTFPWLVQSRPKATRKSAGLSLDPRSSMVNIRAAALRGDPPLGKGVPRHRVWFASGSIWFFNPKMISHQVLFGDGALGHSWTVRESNPDLLPEHYLAMLEGK